jgi:hypothetical protein
MRADRAVRKTVQDYLLDLGVLKGRDPGLDLHLDLAYLLVVTIIADLISAVDRQQTTIAEDPHRAVSTIESGRGIADTVNVADSMAVPDPDPQDSVVDHLLLLLLVDDHHRLLGEGHLPPLRGGPHHPFVADDRPRREEGIR